MTTKAALYRRNGPAADVIEIVELPAPVPAPGEVLVRIAFSGVNPSDVKARAGRPLNGEYQIPHSDGSGIIEAVGEGVPGSRIGERVWTWNAAWRRKDGTCAEYVALPSGQAVHLPDDVSMETGACLGIPGLTAAHGLNLALVAGCRKLLVTGAGSSVGHYIVQMAKAAGMEVAGTASARRAELVRRAGAAHVIDYREADIAEAAREITGGAGFDCILDMDFSSTAPLLAKGILKPAGSHLIYGSNRMDGIEIPFREALFNQFRLQFFLVYSLTPEERAAAMATLDAALSGGLDTRVDSIFGLDEAVSAHHRVEGGEAVGNVLVSC